MFNSNLNSRLFQDVYHLSPLHLCSQLLRLLDLVAPLKSPNSVPQVGDGAIRLASVLGRLTWSALIGYTAYTAE